jgi:hypothetical protein
MQLVIMVDDFCMVPYGEEANRKKATNPQKEGGAIPK